MAVSSTTATVCIPVKNNIHTTLCSPKYAFSNWITFTPKPSRLSIIRTSTTGDFSPDSTDSQSAIEVPQQPSSLISALNVERALRGIPITDVDHYGRLGIPRGTSFEKVAVAYNNKVEEFKKQGLEEEELNKKLEQLKESYLILSSEEERRIYDWSLARTETTDRYVWPFEVDITQTPKGTPPPQEPEDVGPTRVVGYVLVGWIIQSSSIFLNLIR
ncbi:NAD(P)H-quinone oxidoreductase subunit U, chloroplastic [Senna tora]|uniref:NAD(P)H-quinone oxidoreductase subunit U, chloroplastic n=1 Tax=Senna tora TaxID=362788 RepID=A0A834TAG1_9FABA|nr:NAD(P)H-quinone oxidoreductase subunit U, chloroplastic [Senna tora]